MAQSIVSGIPVIQQAKAQRIIDAMKTHPNVVTWNSDWELVHNGVPVPNTNVVDLVNDLVRSKNFNPLGTPQLLQGLKKINFPSAYIGNDDRQQQMMMSPGAVAATPTSTQKKSPTLITPKNGNHTKCILK